MFLCVDPWVCVSRHGQTGMRHVTHGNESRHTWKWVTSHMITSHVTHRNESCHTQEWVRYEGVRYEWVTYEWVTLPIVVKRRIRPHSRSNAGMSHGTHRNESCHTQEWVTYEGVRYEWVTYEWVTLPIVVKRPIRPHSRSNAGMSHGTHQTESCHTHEWVTWHITTSQITHRNDSGRNESRYLSSTSSCPSYTESRTQSRTQKWVSHT